MSVFQTSAVIRLIFFRSLNKPYVVFTDLLKFKLDRLCLCMRHYMRRRFIVKAYFQNWLRICKIRLINPFLAVLQARAARCFDLHTLNRPR
jgi:hypothetical protein